MVSPGVLVDTDVLIEFLRSKQRAQEVLMSAAKSTDLYCSVVTVAELIAGMRVSEKDSTEKLLSGFHLLPVTEAIARQAGFLRQQKKARPILLPDCLIAATAMEHHCALLTFNLKDYPFEALDLYPV